MEDRQRRLRVARRERLIRLIDDLRAELSDLEKVIRGVPAAYTVRLDDSFFWSEVYPIFVESGNDSISNREIRKRLFNKGIEVDRSRFSVYLTRLKSRGLLIYHESKTSRFGTWAMPEHVEYERQRFMRGQ